MSDLVGRKVFWRDRHDPNGSVGGIQEIVAILPPHHDMEDLGNRMRLRDVEGDYEGDAHWVSEIGKEFQLIKEGFPEDELRFFAKWLADRDKAYHVEMSLLEGVGNE